jgi:chemotaxis signal transduction protein
MIRYGLFRYGSLAYAVPLERLRKIVHQCPGFRLPRLPGAVAELLVDVEQLVPVLKLPAVLESEELTARTVEYKVLAESEAGTVAFPAELTCGIVAEQKGRLQSPDDLPAGMSGVFNYQEKDFKILDIDTLAIGMTQGGQT